MDEDSYQELVLANMADQMKQHGVYRANIRCDGVLQNGAYTETWRVTSYLPMEVYAQAHSFADAVRLYITNLKAASVVPAEKNVQLLQIGGPSE